MSSPMDKYYYFIKNNQSYYYIHRHISHFERSNAINFFTQQKNDNYLAMKERYKENYKKSLNFNIGENSLSILNAAMSEDEQIEAIDKALLESLNKNISKGMQNANLNKKMVSAYKSLNDFINKKDFKDLEKVLEQISSATNILTSGNQELVALIGRKGKNNQGIRNKKDLKRLYSMIEQNLISLEGKRTTLNIEKMKAIELELLGFTKTIIKGNYSSEKLTSHLSNIFSTHLGEYLVSYGMLKADKAISKAMKESLVGSKTLKIKEDSQEELWSSEHGQLGSQNFKTDNSFKNISINISTGDNIQIDLGLSTKWYKGGKSGKIYSTAITNESFSNKMSQLLGGYGIIEKYYAYNALGLAEQDNELYSSLKAAILARDLDAMISGSGFQGDFSQFIVLNGEFYSIWEIINAVEKYNSGAGATQGKNSKDPVTISADGLKDIIALTKSVQNSPPNLALAYIRAKRQNNMIKNLGLVGKFYPQRLKGILKQ